LDNITKYLNNVAYKFDKGYPDGPEDMARLFEMVNNLIKEEEPQFNKQELIDFIQGIEDEDTLKKIFKLAKSTGFSKNFKNYLDSKNLTDKDVNYFINLLQDIEKLGEFAAIATNPPKINLSSNNYYSQIPGFTPSELKKLFIDMKDSIKGTVSLGPGENFLSVFFGNISKEGKKGDLNIDGKEIELKSRTGTAGAIVSPRIYNRGDFSTSIKPYLSDFIKNLDLEPEQEEEMLALNEPGVAGSWTKKLNAFYKKYNEFGGDKDLFSKELTNTFKKMYRTLDLDANNFLSNTEFNSGEFTVELAKQLAQAYYDIEKFDGVIFSDPDGNFKYYSEGDFVDKIGSEIKISFPTDLVPRLKI
jgi:hypothetical protein